MFGINLMLLITFACLAINGYTDLRSRRTYTLVYLATYVGLYILSPSILVLGLALATLVFNRDNNLVGGGDLDAVFLILYTLGINKSLTCALIACISSIVFWMIHKDKEIPFVAMLFIGYAVVVYRMIF